MIRNGHVLGNENTNSRIDSYAYSDLSISLLLQPLCPATMSEPIARRMLGCSVKIRVGSYSERIVKEQ
jgi:hypothetical protein